MASSPMRSPSLATPIRCMRARCCLVAPPGVAFLPAIRLLRRGEWCCTTFLLSLRYVGRASTGDEVRRTRALKASTSRAAATTGSSTGVEGEPAEGNASADSTTGEASPERLTMNMLSIDCSTVADDGGGSEGNATAWKSTGDRSREGAGAEERLDGPHAACGPTPETTRVIAKIILIHVPTRTAEEVLPRSPRRPMIHETDLRRDHHLKRHQQIIVLLVLERRSLGNLKPQLPRDETGIQGPSVDLEATKISPSLSVRTHPFDSTRRPKQSRRRAGVPRVRRHALDLQPPEPAASSREAAQRQEAALPQAPPAPSAPSGPAGQDPAWGEQPPPPPAKPKPRGEPEREEPEPLGGLEPERPGNPQSPPAQCPWIPQPPPAERHHHEGSDGVATGTCPAAVGEEPPEGLRLERHNLATWPSPPQRRHLVGLGRPTPAGPPPLGERREVAAALARPRRAHPPLPISLRMADHSRRLRRNHHRGQPSNTLRTRWGHLLQRIHRRAPAAQHLAERTDPMLSESGDASLQRLSMVEGREDPAGVAAMASPASGGGKPLREGENKAAMKGGRRSRSGRRREGDADAGVAAAVAGTLFAPESPFPPEREKT
ncbi:LOW QUALITY PROTEIN: hypothetical protein BRADI_2g53483v3 [Brachypodium distachyon]|uniref:Uncharacterized protein n=1 Tax=Brachypodium distachyon TaxID=15368 RepID=A0A0Q3GGV9_BRADI|nr:LOW QUALITY PROTEIN: hypothetical protein BRADI_2g53483v3 [Brachypodium distachyon]